MAASDRTAAKKTAHRWFSKYIRLRDCIATTGTTERARCITCGEIKDFKKCDCGHYVPGRSDSVLFDEHNAHAQCNSCNRWRQGMFIEYEIALVTKYGADEVERLKSLKFRPFKYSLAELNWQASNYRLAYKQLLEDNK